MEPVVRRATASDVDDLLRLRAVMVAAVGGGDPLPGEWVDHARNELAEQLPDADGDLVAFVVDDEAGHPVTCALGVIQRTIASPSRPDGRSGYVFNVATDPEYRGRGYATAVMKALIAWFHDKGVMKVDLKASEQGASIYERLGFRLSRDPSYSLEFVPDPEVR